jgi:hypothetical protein
MNVQKEEIVEDSLEWLMADEEGEIVDDLFDKIQEQYLETLTIVCYKRECAKKKYEFVRKR